MGSASLKLPHPYQPSPEVRPSRPTHRHFRGLLSVHSRCGLHTRTVTYVTVIRGLQTFRHLHACPGCFRLEHSQVGLSPTGKRRLGTAHGHSCHSGLRPGTSGLSETRYSCDRPYYIANVRACGLTGNSPRGAARLEAAVSSGQAGYSEERVDRCENVGITETKRGICSNHLIVKFRSDMLFRRGCLCDQLA